MAFQSEEFLSSIGVPHLTSSVVATCNETEEGDIHDSIHREMVWSTDQDPDLLKATLVSGRM